MHWDSIIITESVPSKQAWMESTRGDVNRNTLRTGLDDPNSIFLGTIDQQQTHTISDCWCAAKVRPEIEYQVIYPHKDDFQDEVNSLLEDGWLPMGGVSHWLNANKLVQGFWRYAE